MSLHRRFQALTMREMKNLLNEDEDVILNAFNKRAESFENYIERRDYSEIDVDLILKLISSACQSENTASVKKLLRIVLKNEFFFRDCMRAIEFLVSGDSNINPSCTIENFAFIIYCMARNCLAKVDDVSVFQYNLVSEVFHKLQKIVKDMKHKTDMRTYSHNITELMFKIGKQLNHWDVTLKEKPEEPKDFRELSIFPQAEEMRANDDFMYALRPNIVSGRYVDVEDYLDIHFKLMREDMVRTFKKEYKSVFEKDAASSHIKLYKDVKIFHPPSYTLYGLSYTVHISFEQKSNSSNRKCLIPGSLLCFMDPKDENSSIVFATIKKCDDVIEGSKKKFQLKVAIEEHESKISADNNYNVLEVSAYFESYRHVLTILKTLNSRNFPFPDHFVEMEFDNFVPRFLKDFIFCLHENCPEDFHNPKEKNNLRDSNKSKEQPVEEDSCKRFSPIKFKDWPSAEELKLDSYQLDAFQLALTRKVALIQGPPGTGKTFLGSKIVKAILDNIPMKPIVICCVTNHALDQFLLHSLKHTKRIVRIGSQSQTKDMDPYRLDYMKRCINVYKNEGIEGIKNLLLFETYNTVRELVPDIFESHSTPMPDDALCKFQDLILLLNSKLRNYFMCTDSFMKPDALNLILPLEFKKKLCGEHGKVMSILSENMKEWLDVKSSGIETSMEKCLKKWEQLKNKKTNEKRSNKIDRLSNIYELPLSERFSLFRDWREECLVAAKSELENLEEQFWENLKYVSKPDDFKTFSLLKATDIIGVTMTGAAKNYDMLSLVQPAIMIVEEAAEALESHLLTSIVPSIEQIIMIGDHKQLRPIPADDELSKHYKLAISLFERLCINDMPHATLVTQHRMRPCIAELLVPHIYDDLKHHESVKKFDNIKGMKFNMYFLKHNEQESQEGNSFSNKFEANLITTLAIYFLNQGYEASQLTVLAMYNAQICMLQKYFSELSACHKGLLGVRITTVDNFQGEENDILMISFVRSNESKLIGFLRESNRTCVALSRARKGLFCVGNFDMLAEKDWLWGSIAEMLVENEMIGDSLPFCCEQHNSEVEIRSADDICSFISEGCKQICGFQLECGHTCMRTCHSDDADHKVHKCMEPCDKILIDDTGAKPKEVKCIGRCYEPCRVKKKKIILPCGHKVSLGIVNVSSYKCQYEVDKKLSCKHLVKVPCSTKPEDFKCFKLVPVTLECGHKISVECGSKDRTDNLYCDQLTPMIAPCGHTVNIPCNRRTGEDDLLLSYCEDPCDQLLDCGHACVGACKICFSMKIHPMCTFKCELMLACGHVCNGTCGAPCLPCNERCEFRCPHTRCINPCSKACVQCEKKCARDCDHNSCSLPCFMECEVPPCLEKCPKKLDCKHPCIGLCGDPCPPLCRYHDKDSLMSDDPENDRYVLLQDCEHVVEIKSLTKHIQQSILCCEWPSCPVKDCGIMIRNSRRFSDELKKIKNAISDSYNIIDDLDEIQYTFHTMFGLDNEPTWRFLAVQKKIRDILECKVLSPASLIILNKCILCLKKMVWIENSINSNPYAIDKFESLIMWIDDHLEVASYQQLMELETEVKALEARYFSQTSHVD